MKVFRLGKQKYISDLSGMGSYISGARWNNKGTYMLYTSQSRALALTELSVRLPLGRVPQDYHYLILEIPDDLILALDLSLLDHIDWKTSPPSPETQALGDRFIRESSHLALKVPSVVVDGDFNYLLNPNFPDFDTLVIPMEKGPFPFDQRLFIRPGDR